MNLEDGPYFNARNIESIFSGKSYALPRLDGVPFLERGRSMLVIQSCNMHVYPSDNA